MCATFVVLDLVIIYNVKLVNAEQWLCNDFLLPLTLLCVCARLVPLQLTSLFFVNKGQCYGCTRDGDVGMKHPSSSVGYTAGHLNVGLPSGYYGKWKRDYEDEEDDDKYV
jgi:hypothetical protein